MKYLFSFFAFISLMAGNPFSHLYAQHGLHLHFLPGQPEAQLYQPAYLAGMGERIVQAGAIGGYDLGNNAFTLETLLADDQFLDQQDKDHLISQLGPDNRINLGYGIGGILNFKLAKLPLSLSYTRNNTISIGVPNPETVGLILYGNSRYAGQTLTDKGIFSLNQTYDAVALGSAVKVGKLQLGMRVKLLLGSRMNAIDHLDYSLTTAPLGTSITLKGDYNFFETTPADDNHLGIAVDIGGTFKVSEKLDLQFAARDLGFIQWKGKQFANTVDFTYRGVLVENILNTNVTGGSSLIAVDTIRTLFFPDSVASTLSQSLPSALMIGGSYQLGENDLIFMSIHYSPSRYSSYNNAPLVNLGYHRTLANFLTLGANVYGGGVDQFGVGLFGRASFAMANRHQLSLFYALENGTGWIFPSGGKGYSMQAGLGFAWGK